MIDYLVGDTIAEGYAFAIHKSTLQSQFPDLSKEDANALIKLDTLASMVVIQSQGSVLRLMNGLGRGKAFGGARV
jgi:hypothetical protein